MANGHGGARRGAGKKKGTVHEATRIAKTAIENAFAHLQGREGKDFNTWAENNTDDFYKLLFPKLLPVQMQHSGDPDGDPIRVSRIELSAPILNATAEQYVNGHGEHAKDRASS